MTSRRSIELSNLSTRPAAWARAAVRLAVACDTSRSSAMLPIRSGRSCSAKTRRSRMSHGST